ncbi:hypothetical protein MUK60_42340 [Streptomyces sp. LRE541]|nr:hypothetical protein [Streptomyces sp. LRE541]UPZ34572.1 hypothetical protein MUK60_42340 [Streptomyces sp. LRE541]
MAQDPGLGPRQQPPLPLIKVWEQHLELHGQLIASLTRRTHTRSTT